MFERFTAPARQVVVLAQEQAHRLGHRSIGTEHLLIALAAQEDGPASRTLHDRGLSAARVRAAVVGLLGDRLDAQALAVLGIDLDRVRKATEARFGMGALDPRPTAKAIRRHLPISGHAKSALGLSARAAATTGDRSISTGHLLIGIIDEGEGLAGKVLRSQGIDLVDLRDATTSAICAAAA